jgi:hypothetical protein
MIQMTYIDGMCCPFIHCDHCGRKIEDYRKAIAVFGAPPEGDMSNAVRHVHKACDYERPDPRREPLWQPLHEHLLALVYNTGLQSRQFKALVRQTCLYKWA